MKLKALSNQAINYELKLNFLDDSGQLKGSINRLNYIAAESKDVIFTEDFGWGNTSGTSWKDHKYSVEVVFMDVLIGATTFNCNLIEEEGEPLLIKTFE